MLRRRKIRKLSKAVKERQELALTYSWCYICLENFIDDIPYDVNCRCPNGCPCILEKGHTKPYIPTHTEVKVTRKVRAKSKSKVSRKAARKAAKKNVKN